MNVAINPPNGSRLSVESVDGQQTIVAPPQARGAPIVFQATFLPFWLCIWTIGGVTVATKLIAGKGSTFEGVWLLAWLFGELFALFTLYRILRPSIPERFTLRADGLGYDSGLAPPRMYAGYSRSFAWRDAWPKRLRRVFSRGALETLRLREGGDANRLTIDAGADRFDLGKNCSEVEREWLYQTLRAFYRLPDPVRD
jgi:hypothetical protein